MPTEAAYGELWARFSRNAPSTKEIESTVEGEPSCIVEVTLQSYFDYYPAVRRQVTALSGSSKAEAVDLMRAFLHFLETGSKARLRNPRELGLGVEIDLTADETPAYAVQASENEGAGIWQVSLGEDGWADLDDATNELCEKARRENQALFTFTGFTSMHYSIDVEKLVQTNKMSGTVRPIRRTTNALFG
eukprot:CAMPEP_0179985194 /NCGR_PEP_ID=MMETSP0984-20121128/1556_1 /TAXON_ID=483367 /ORGANISM="non described non described, Strain CCMP 2436" /LENGTH=189 /DNA_ID=CAMNT_0021903871 /DNA_START=80 /DNA_END=650 /DNA_ORIENTATION=+